MCWKGPLRNILRKMRRKRKVTPPVATYSSEDVQVSNESTKGNLLDLEHSTRIFLDEHIQKLQHFVPAKVAGHRYSKIFSTMNDGFNMTTMYRKVSNYEKPVILLIRDTNGAVFGAILTHSLKPDNPRFYGGDESLLFTFHPEFKVFRTTGANGYYIKADKDSLIFGAGDGIFGLWIDGELNHGRSQRCATFGNDVLSSSEDFTINLMEIWGFSDPCEER